MPGINLSEDLSSLICEGKVPRFLGSVDKLRVDLETDSEFLEYTDANLNEDLRRLRDYTFSQTDIPKYN
nr:hypothetical protein [Nanoarchaeum sp.]